MAGGSDFVECCPGRNAEVEGEGGGGREGVIEGVAEGVSGVAAESDMGSGRQGGVHAGWREKCMSNTVIPDLDEGIGEELR